MMANEDGWKVAIGCGLEAYEAGQAPRVRLTATHKRTLEIVPMDALREMALERN